MQKELNEMKLSTGAQVQLYHMLPPMALVAEKAHALHVNKQAVTSNHRVGSEEGFNLVATRAGESVQANAELRFSKD